LLIATQLNMEFVV